VPRIRLIAGPNGSGKTTLLKTLVKNKVPAEITPDGYLEIFDKQFDKANPAWFVDNLLKKWPRDKVRIATL
jgi:ABC-type cobalamin/Fe3+-siderophores transport system ATPase subunit